MELVRLAFQLLMLVGVLLMLVGVLLDILVLGLDIDLEQDQKPEHLNTPIIYYRYA